MRTESRVLTGLAALLLVPVFTLPLWSIRLVAPQYREGLGMYIGLRDIWGHTMHDIQNINILNHYIGMRPIVPAEVDVLTIMPWAVGALMVGALVAAAIGRRVALAAWLLAFTVLGAAGLYEFHAWNYEFGHNLSPDAPIKVPGMTYQPPLLGTTTLLNIRASSFPSWGTLFVGLSFLTVVAALWLDIQTARQARTGAGVAAGPRVANRLAATIALAMTVALTACGGGAPAAAAAPEFAPGAVPCDYCEGVIPEARFGGELVTHAGERFSFMSIECLAGFILADRVAADDIAAVRVVDYNHGERLVELEDAIFIRSQFRESPNGMSLLATDSERIAGNLLRFFGGERLEWAGVLALVREEWSL